MAPQIHPQPAAPPLPSQASTSPFHAQRSILLSEIAISLDHVLQNINKLNRSLEGVIAVGNEFGNVEGLWSVFEGVMRREKEEGQGEEEEEEGGEGDGREGKEEGRGEEEEEGDEEGEEGDGEEGQQVTGGRGRG
ncbi:MAG: Dolichyl-diphosphooligosaccharide-protein glycosyltransferase subunit dad1 [Ramalina farinacea]|uniref:DASH complex subunit DAD1 n=1 Tax=Ramalina farinacea TaxID=258253 RepID=A0AA43QHE0_9LECA|nr:Dolichyl-diphosphooligosaccharide-protein glycosyltransferase subunit dad1 [Ramalina farinacea]